MTDIECQQQGKVRVYYNSACPVCKAGAEWMKDSLQCQEEWNDVHSNPALVDDLNSELEKVRERLHVVDDNGRVHIGFEAFLVIWQNSKHRGDRFKARLFSLIGLRQFCNVFYNFLARGLYKWNRWKKHW